MWGRGGGGRRWQFTPCHASSMLGACYSHAMANIQVKNVPDELHERLRRYAREENCTMSAAVLAAIERELSRAEWRRRMANRPIIDLGVPAAQLIEEARAERDRELGIE